MQQNASTEYKSATNKAKQLYKAFWVTGTAFFHVEIGAVLHKT